MVIVVQMFAISQILMIYIMQIFFE